MSCSTHQRCYEKVVVVIDHADLVGVHEDPLDLLEGAVEDDVELLRVGRVLDLLQHGAVVVAERVQLVQGELDALVALGELEHLLESDQRLLVLVYHHERLPVEGLEEARICLKEVEGLVVIELSGPFFEKLGRCTCPKTDGCGLMFMEKGLLSEE